MLFAKKLNWHSSFGEQLQGIELAKEIDDLSLLILPCANGESKGLWENCAKVLINKSDEYLLTAHKYSLSVAKKMQDSVWEKVLRDFLVEYIQKGTLSPEEIKELN